MASSVVKTVSLSVSGMEFLPFVLILYDFIAKIVPTHIYEIHLVS